jgi:(heptosyl)LPS beta-1,4-glucosyltransferase
VKKISVVVNTLNEERNLPRALASVENWADEIVVVDMRSDDATVEIATKHGARVFGHERTGYVEPARNFAIDKASCDWILILDADEEVPRTLASILVKEVRNPRADYYRLPRRNIVFGKWLKHSRWWPDYNIRFFKKGSVSWNEVIHSVPMTKGEGADLDPSKEYALIHHHYESVEQFISRLNRYTTEHSRVLIRRGYKFDWHDIIVKPVGEFLSRYFFGEGYKDGLHGLVLSGLQGFSEFVLYL